MILIKKMTMVRPLYKPVFHWLLVLVILTQVFQKLNGLFLMIIRTALFQLILTVNIFSNSSDIVINNKSIKTDHNLLTSIDFNLVVESNTNGNEVTVKLTDNAGNSEVKRVKYSIDTTVPKITAVKSNVNSSNGNYYNTAQTVTVTITERNFNPKDVEVKCKRQCSNYRLGTR